MVEEISISKGIYKRKNYLFAIPATLYIGMTPLIISMYLTGYEDYTNGVMWGLIGCFLFLTWRIMNDDTRKRHHLLLMSVCFLLFYFNLNYFPIAIVGLLFLFSYLYNWYDDYKEWKKQYKITL